MAEIPRRVRSELTEVNQLWEAMELVERRLEGQSLGRWSNKIEGVELVAATPLVINHLLTRQPSEWEITDIDAAVASIHRTDWNADTITLEASANCTVTVRVYE